MDEEVESHHDFSGEEEGARRPRIRERVKHQPMNFQVEILMFEGKLNPNAFLDWLNTVERVFEYKEMPDDKKVKLMTLKLRKYVSIWRSNVLTKRARKGKSKIRSWRKIRKNLRLIFSHPITFKPIIPNSITLGKNLRVWRSIPGSLKDFS